MTHTKFFAAAALLAVAWSVGAHAQEAQSGRAMEAASTGLPEICRSEAGMAATKMMPSMQMRDPMMSEGQMAMMEGMDQMHRDMMMGSMAEDTDVAFVCGMIPHHLGAIAMARAELEHGDDDWAQQKAQAIIEAQQQEIADMITWLEEQN